MDYSKMSDEELEALASAPKTQQALDYSSMSDEDLEKLANPPSVLASGARGLAQGASFGFADEIAGGLESAFSNKTYEQARDESRANFKTAREANPKSFLAGEIGGAVGSALIPIPGLGAANIARAGATAAKVGRAGLAARAIGTAGVLGGVGGLGASEAKDAGGMAIDTLKGAGTGLALGSAGVGLAAGAKALAPVIGQGLKLTPKANQAQIIEAMDRLGAKPTQAMLFEDEVLGGLESSLSQSPSLGGMMMRRSTKPVEEAIDSVTKSALAESSALSPFASGQTAKAGMAEAIEKKFAPSREIYNELAEATPHMEVNAKSLERVGKNISKIDDVRLMPTSPQAKRALQAAEDLQNVRSIADLRKIKSRVGADLKAAEGSEKMVLGELYAKMHRLEQNSMMRSAVDTMRGFARKADGKTGDKLALEGEQIGKDMVAKLKTANKSYSGEMRNVDAFNKNAGLRESVNPQQFKSNIDAIDSEKIADTLFNPGDFRQMQTMKTQFPEQAEILRRAQLAKIESKVTNADGSLSTPNFLRTSNKLGNEASQELFGAQNLEKISDAQTALQALPEYIGPSGTPKGMAYAQMLNPYTQLQEAGKYAAYKGMTDPRTQKVADYLMKSPKIQSLAKENPKAFQAMVLDFSKRAGYTERALPKVAGPAGELDTDSGRSSSYQPTQGMPDAQDAKDKFLKGN